jgi:hypothetical protein
MIAMHASRPNFICFVQPLERLERSIMKETKVPDDLRVISCEEDYQTCAPLLERGKSYLHCTSYTIFIEQSGQPANVHGYPLGASVFSSELVLNCIIIKKLDYERRAKFKTIQTVILLHFFSSIYQYSSLWYRQSFCGPCQANPFDEVDKCGLRSLSNSKHCIIRSFSIGL